ncbi:uncharacterized protein BDV17DRAFT_290232 [Aspergillus undulatus]|uniref:uncharacterized protein n=1 Tax=Aspergillus undulatus TaxID=1810928 RepID=UPI003CCD6344
MDFLNRLPEDFHVVLTQYLLTRLLTSTIVGYSSQSSPARPAALASIVALSVSVQRIVTTWSDHRPLVTTILLFTFLNAAIALDLFLITKATYSDHVQWLQNQKTKGFQPSLGHRVNWALQMPVNYRRIGTKWRISQSPLFDSATADHVPTRTVFLIHRLLTTILGTAVFFYLWANPATLSQRFTR